jgi:hypothetical protein
MTIRQRISSASHAVGRAIDKFTPWARDIERAEAYQAACEPVLPPTKEYLERGADPPDALPLDRPRVDLAAYAAEAREVLRAESDLRPMTEIRQEAIGEDDLRHDDALFDRWFGGLAAGLREWRERDRAGGRETGS